MTTIFTRSGALLIIVTGMAALVLSLGLAFLSVMRADGRHTLAVVQDAQARAMLQAAKAYILESSRIGWGDQETLGWNDIRNHAVGPIPIDRDPWAGPGDEPEHRVWTAGQWPAPGSVLRAPMRVWTRPPFAVRPGIRNPVVAYPSAADLPNGSGIYDHASGDGRMVLQNHNGMNWTGASLADSWRLGQFRNPDPQPLVDPATVAWAQGDRLPRIRSQHLAWFRIYRETAADHDGDGVPFYDVVDCNGGSSPGRNGEARAHPPNASIFLVTCGAGASLGFRDWAEVVAAGATEVFNHEESQFNLVRSSETILWYRLEWTPMIGGSAGKGRRQASSSTAYHTGFSVSNALVYDVSAATYRSPAHFGSIRWVQRLDRKPPVW